MGCLAGIFLLWLGAWYLVFKVFVLLVKALIYAAVVFVALVLHLISSLRIRLGA